MNESRAQQVPPKAGLCTDFINAAVIGDEALSAMHMQMGNCVRTRFGFGAGCARRPAAALGARDGNERAHSHAAAPDTALPLPLSSATPTYSNSNKAESALALKEHLAQQ